MGCPNRAAAIGRLADGIAKLYRNHPVRVAIDGVDAAGKTTLADELARLIRDRGRTVIRAGIDGFHNPKETRHRDPDPARGYFRDSFDYLALRRCLLEPLGPGGNLQYCTAVYDYRTETYVDALLRTAASNEVLLFDGVFLLREDIRDAWDLTIFVDVKFRTVLKRVVVRDKPLLGDRGSIRRRYRSRYIPGQRIYLRSECPREKSMIIVENDRPSHPRVRYNISLEPSA